jgi:hypothetical protein
MMHQLRQIGVLIPCLIVCVLLDSVSSEYALFALKSSALRTYLMWRLLGGGQSSGDHQMHLLPPKGIPDRTDD